MVVGITRDSLSRRRGPQWHRSRPCPHVLTIRSGGGKNEKVGVKSQHTPRSKNNKRQGQKPKTVTNHAG